jgi:hypothetical protein
VKVLIGAARAKKCQSGKNKKNEPLQISCARTASEK